MQDSSNSHGAGLPFVTCTRGRWQLPQQRDDGGGGSMHSKCTKMDDARHHIACRVPIAHLSESNSQRREQERGEEELDSDCVPGGTGLANPKSQTLRCPCESSSRFSGLRSRYTMSWLCMYSNACPCPHRSISALARLNSSATVPSQISHTVRDELSRTVPSEIILPLSEVQ